MTSPSAPLDPANRRISLIVQYIPKNTDEEEDKATAGEKKTERNETEGNKSGDKKNEEKAARKSAEGESKKE